MIGDPSINYKTCGMCSVSKPLKEFHVRAVSEDGRQARCKDCQKTSRGQKHSQNKILMDKFRENGCYFCKEKTPVCLDAHHVDPALKEIGISTLWATGYSAAVLLEEISKCICLCSNCHKKVHAGLLVCPPLAEAGMELYDDSVPVGWIDGQLES